MPGFLPPSGEGAFSTGPMVVVHDARNVGEARAIVELLEQNHIPALVNLEVEGIVFPWQEPSTNGSARVLVPSKMLANAREILKRANPSAAPPPPPMRMTPPPQARFQLREGEARARPTFARELPRVYENPPVEPVGSEEETGPIDLELPEPSPLAPRILAAMLAIAFGIAFQRVLESAFGFGSGGTLARFAAGDQMWSEPWRLVTASFLHMGPEHFISNAAFGALIGIVLFGTHQFGSTMLVWLVSSMVGMIAESLLSGSGVLIAGASAGNYGLVGLWAKGQLERAQLSLLSRRERIRTIGILLLLLPGALTPVTSTGSRVAVFAHAMGFLAGAVLGFVFERRLIPERFARIRRRSRIAFVAAVVLTALGIGAGMLANPPIQ